MANPYQIEDWESMASVRSKLNQMGEAVDWAASKEYVDNKSPEVVSAVPTTYVTDKLYLIVKSNGWTNWNSPS